MLDAGDARAIERLARPGARVLQMGAGFIGCIIMEALAARGVELTVVEMGDRMVPRMMGPTAGGMIKEWCESKGVSRCITGDARSRRIEAQARERPTGAGRRCGVGGSAMRSAVQQLDADLVISATGVQAEHRLPAGLGHRRACVGVLTDEHLQTNVPGVYAAGDCAEAFDKVTARPSSARSSPTPPSRRASRR